MNKVTKSSRSLSEIPQKPKFQKQAPKSSFTLNDYHYMKLEKNRQIRKLISLRMEIDKNIL